MKRIILIAGLMGTALACGTAMAAPAYIEKAVSDAGRPADDTKRDAQRLPALLTEFAGIKPGMTVDFNVPEYPGKTFTATLAASAGAVASSSGTQLPCGSGSVGMTLST